MRFLVSVTVASLSWLILLTFCLAAGEVNSEDETSIVAKELEDPSLEIESKRDWNRNLHSWGKRAWQRLQGGWGKRDLSYNLHYPYADKRAWHKLQGGWGKRFSPEDQITMKQLAAIVDQEAPDSQNDEIEETPETDINSEEKRAWKGLNGGWGKRDSWSSFRGSWGKREPAWTNLKGMWGKRAYLDKISQ